MCELNEDMEYLVSLPPNMATAFDSLLGEDRPGWRAFSDPPGSKLGSGGGTANLLVRAWQGGSPPGVPFADWLKVSRKLIVHGSGESRRLPAYAAEGKPLMPIPVARWARGQRLDQTLLDLQLPVYRRVLAQAPNCTAALVASGDVLPRFGHDLPPFPEVDVLGLGMWVTPEIAKDFGVFFVPRANPEQLAFFLQKPSPARIRELTSEHLYLVDTGMWLLSGRAVQVLLERCGWDAQRQAFTAGKPASYELYAQFGLALGQVPTAADELVRTLSCGVVPLPDPEFYHFGTSRQLIESVSALQNIELDGRKLGLAGARRHPDQYVQNSVFRCPLRRDENHTLWVENSRVPATWKLACAHVLTGVPENDWDLQLEPGVCLDLAPIGKKEWSLRIYGIDDTFRGCVGDSNTIWLGEPVATWFTRRGLDPARVGMDPPMDIFSAPLFPIVEPGRINPRFVEWLFTRRPAKSEEFARQWIESRRLSARLMAEEVELRRLYAQRVANRKQCLKPMLQNSRWSVFLNLDLEATADLYARSEEPLPAEVPSIGGEGDLMRQARERMFRAAVLRQRGAEEWAGEEAEAFAYLRQMIAREAEMQPSNPRCTVQEDQIVWGRSPVRLDLAGGWTDTPPYCLENGGSVVNFAANLNGQPPIQAFAKMSPRPELVMRSIDLGAEERVSTYEELASFAQPGSEFAIAKAALALAGFLPRFQAGPRYGSLREQLEAFGGGIEISLLCAVPKGSGLGTSSLLAATVLATVGNLCGLSWDQNTLFSRTLVLEQLMTTGGGWQDQIGGIYHGIKLIETEPGLKQQPTLRWLPSDLLGPQVANQTVLLYYTGLTRLAKGILNEIVRAVFLNSPSHLRILEEIGANGEFIYGALQRLDFEGVAAGIRTSWLLNQRLDAGTNPPAMQKILNQVEDYLAAAKLLGAGGGGYLLMLAKDKEAATRIRETLTTHPPNPRARFVDFELSRTGLELTRS
jgi:galactokinase/mevalonate kinase-like predicted kinase